MDGPKPGLRKEEGRAWGQHPHLVKKTTLQKHAQQSKTIFPSWKRQIDHIGIKKMFRRSLQDVRVKRGADVASDHNIVTARLKLKLRRIEVDQERRRGRYNVDYLKDQKQHKNTKLL